MTWSPALRHLFLCVEYVCAPNVCNKRPQCEKMIKNTIFVLFFFCEVSGAQKEDPSAQKLDHYSRWTGPLSTCRAAVGTGGAMWHSRIGRAPRAVDPAQSMPRAPRRAPRLSTWRPPIGWHQPPVGARDTWRAMTDLGAERMPATYPGPPLWISGARKLGLYSKVGFFLIFL